MSTERNCSCDMPPKFHADSCPLHRRPSEVNPAQLPRLTRRMIYAAAIGHYGKARVDEVGIEGIAMTVDGNDYTFEAAFRRMWAGIRAGLKAEGRS